MKLILLLLLIVPSIVFSQVESVKIDKPQTYLFRGEGQEMRNCYLYIDSEGIYYLVNLTTVAQSEVAQWFEKRKNSQNIYKGTVESGQYKTLSLVKDDEQGASISFYYERKERSEIQLISLQDGRIFIFKLIAS